MVLSVKSEIMKSHEAYPKSRREEWVLEWAGQVVLCVSMIYWTAQVENSLSATGVEELHSCFDLQLEFYLSLQMSVLALTTKHL